MASPAQQPLHPSRPIFLFDLDQRLPVRADGARCGAGNCRVWRGAGATFWVPMLDAPLTAELRVRIPAREVILAGRPPEAISLRNIVPGGVRSITADAAKRSVLVEIAL